MMYLQPRALISWGTYFHLLNFGHEATDTGLAYAPVSQAHGHNHIVQCISSLHCSANQLCNTPGGCRPCFGLGHLYIEVSSHPPPSHSAGAG